MKLRAALALLALASARADLCARGLTASINDKNICCPRMCKYTGVENQGGTCDEQQCQLGNGKCCPAQILKQRVPCKAPEEVGCVFAQNLDKLNTARAEGLHLAPRVLLTLRRAEGIERAGDPGA